MYVELKEEIDDYIKEWYYGEKQYKFAFELGEFILYFLDYIESLEVSIATKRKHYSNSWYIGYLESNYGCREKFIPEILKNGPHYEYEFNRKFGGSKYAMQSYKSTWKKLHKYIEDKKYLINHTSLKYVGEENQITELESIILKIVKYLEEVDENFGEKNIINYSRKVICNYIDYEDRITNKHYIDQIKESLKNINLIKEILSEYKVDKQKSMILKKLKTELESIEGQMIDSILNIP